MQHKKNSVLCTLTAVLLTAVLLLCVGCAPRVVQTDFENLAYGEDEQQVMDLYFPTEYQKQLPVIVLIHGGEWVRGDKSTFSQTAKEYTQTFGVIAASINYLIISFVNFACVNNPDNFFIKYDCKIIYHSIGQNYLAVDNTFHIFSPSVKNRYTLMLS